jgi:hypothetical protein
MRTHRFLIVIALTALVGLGIGWGLVQGQTRKVVAPESLLPEDSVLLVHVDGALSHSEAFQKTAAYDALYKSGLIGFFEKTFDRAKKMAGPLPTKPYLDAINVIVEKGFSIAVTPGVGEQGPQPWAVAVLHDGAALDKLISSTIQLASNGELKPTKKTIGKRTIVRLDIPDSPGVELGWWPEGKHLVVAIGLNAIEQSLAIIDAKSPNVTTNSLWAKYSQSEQSELTSFGWLNLVSLRSLFGGMPVPTKNSESQTTVQEILVTLGLDNLNSIGIQAGIKGRSLTSLSVIDAPGERRGLLSLLNQEPIKLTDLPPLPEKLSALMVSSCDSARAAQTVWDVAVGLEKLLSPDTSNLTTARDTAKNQLGIDVIDDLLAGLGNVTCLYNDEAQTGFGIAPTLVVEVADAAKLNAAWDHLLVQMLPQVSQGKARGVVVDQNGTKTYTIESPQLGISPAISVSEKWMCVSLLPQPVAAFNLRVAGELPVWDSQSLPRETLAEVPESFTGLTIVDPRATYRLILGLAPIAAGVAQAAIAQSAVQSGGEEGNDPPANPPMIFQISDLPPAELVTKWLYPNVVSTMVDENGATTKTSSSLPGLPIPGGDSGAASVAVPAVLVALLLPAVQQAREAARRTQSKNNLKQIGLAMHNYHDTFENFPSGAFENADLGVDQRLSWMVSLLPFIDQSGLYNQLKLDEGFSSETNQPLLETPIITYMNPGYSPDGFLTHYVGIGGLTEDGPTAELPSKIAGVFGYDRKTKISDITDGTSNTVMVAESTGLSGPWGQGGPATVVPLTQPPYINGPDGIGGPFRGGCHFLMADGSVRFVSENTDPIVIEKLATIQGGEVVEDF